MGASLAVILPVAPDNRVVAVLLRDLSEAGKFAVLRMQRLGLLAMTLVFASTGMKFVGCTSCCGAHKSLFLHKVVCNLELSRFNVARLSQRERRVLTK
jgi:hypothetical protein